MIWFPAFVFTYNRKIGEQRNKIWKMFLTFEARVYTFGGSLFYFYPTFALYF